MEGRCAEVMASWGKAPATKEKSGKGTQTDTINGQAYVLDDTGSVVYLATLTPQTTSVEFAGLSADVSDHHAWITELSSSKILKADVSEYEGYLAFGSPLAFVDWDNIPDPTVNVAPASVAPLNEHSQTTVNPDHGPFLLRFWCHNAYID
jgi:hypothetical protein